jgi:DNA-binding MarR family transcriptional regulator
METAIATLQALEDAATTRTRDEVKPIHVTLAERRGLDEATVADLVKALERDGHFLHPIVVRAEGADDYRLVAGLHRLEAWTRRFGDQRPIPAIVYPSDTPDEQITVLEIEENLLRKELTAAERETLTIRLAGALKKLEGEKPATGLPVSGSTATSGGRGKKAATAKLAGKLGVTKTAVQKRIKAASAAIGETIDLDRDTPEELERKADKRQHAGTVERPRRSKPGGATKGSTGAAADVDGQLEDLWKTFDALGRTHQLRFIHAACLGLGLDPVKMAPPAVFGLADDDPEPAVEPPVAPDDSAVGSDAGQGDDAADNGAEDLQDAGHNATEVGEKPGGPVKCGYCPFLIEGLDQRSMVAGRPYHADCAKYAKPTAIAA